MQTTVELWLWTLYPAYVNFQNTTEILEYNKRFAKDVKIKNEIKYNKILANIFSFWSFGCWRDLYQVYQHKKNDMVLILILLCLQFKI